MRSDKQGIEPRKYAEHLVGILGCPKLISQSCRDSSLNSVNSLIISEKIKSSVNPSKIGNPLISTLANSEDPDEMPHNAAFCQGLHFLIRQNQSSEKEIQ